MLKVRCRCTGRGQSGRKSKHKSKHESGNRIVFGGPFRVVLTSLRANPEFSLASVHRVETHFRPRFQGRMMTRQTLAQDQKDSSSLGLGSTRAPSRIHWLFAAVVDHPVCLMRSAGGNAA